MDKTTMPHDPIKARYWAEKRARRDKPRKLTPAQMMSRFARLISAGLMHLGSTSPTGSNDGARNNGLHDRRRAFIEAYNANPLNVLPGRVVHELYRTCKTQAEMERKGRDWLARRERRVAA